MIGNSRILETDLSMYNQMLDIIAQVNYEVNIKRSSWPKDIISWADNEVKFRVPVHVSKGPIMLQVQKRLAPMPSLLKAGPHNVIDAQTKRITSDLFKHKCDVVSQLSPDTKAIQPIPVNVVNSGFNDLVGLGRKIFWSYDYNIGLAHKMRDLDWNKIFTFCKENNKALEINAFPSRLDLADEVVRMAVAKEVELVIDTDSHAVEQMDLMEYGVSVARRGWATKLNILNAKSYNEVKEWIKK
jgi:hypothetical protein